MPFLKGGVSSGNLERTYIILVAAGIVEWFVQKEPTKRWTWPGLLQALFLTVAALIVPIAFLSGLLEELLPIFGLLLLLGLIFYLVRIGWRVLSESPLRGGERAWVFFGGIWLVVFVEIFLYAIVGVQGDFEALPPWYGALFVHSAFVGMMTNLLMGVYSARTRDAERVLSWGEPTAMWLINLGLLVFFGLKIAADSHLGAIVMGVGVLLGVATMILRLRASGEEGTEMSSVEAAA